MFSLNVIDLVRMDSDQVAHNYTVHAGVAERTAGLVQNGRVVIAFLLALSTGVAVANLVYPEPSLRITSVAVTATALIAFALYGMFGLESRLLAHRAFAHRLWLISERYRLLLSEVNEGSVDGRMLLQRRDALVMDLHRVYEHAFGVDQAGHERDRLPVLAEERAA
jgi:hypothetical protein